ncbi:MAG: roadblock/LC7 domain-containing protein [Anaerolineales bacterium]|nr:roadblock/LC7 domain-containing protein [Anaerolineales bacterium]
MKAILDDLNAVAGVTGAFVCDGDGRLLASSLKTPISDDILAMVAKTLNRTAEGVHSLQGKKATDVEMVFESGIVVLKPLEPGCLCILCTPKVSIPMLNLTANMAARQAKKAIAGGAVALAPGPAPAGKGIPS